MGRAAEEFGWTQNRPTQKLFDKTTDITVHNKYLVDHDRPGAERVFA